MGELYGGREAETGRSLKSKRVQESRDRESAEGSKNSRRIVALLRVEFLLKTDSGYLKDTFDSRVFIEN